MASTVLKSTCRSFAESAIARVCCAELVGPPGEVLLPEVGDLVAHDPDLGLGAAGDLAGVGEVLADLRLGRQP